MSDKAIVERIISDAQAEAREILAEAEMRAAETVNEANLRAERNRAGAEAEVKKKMQSILDGKAATARLDSAKILLGEKRGVIDKIYSRALKQLTELGKAEAVYLSERLLKEYAEEGDEIVFAAGFKYSREVSALDIVKEKGLKVSPKTADIDGGFILRGKNSDKNLSYGALLAADREQYQAEIAASIFNN